VAGAAPKIIALVPDLLVASRIQAAARSANAQVETVDTPGEALSRLEGDAARLLIIDLALPGLDLVALATAAQAAGAGIIAFGPHVDVALRQSALAAGIPHVYPRSRFLRDLPALLAYHVSG